jgi:hypothetical protein
MEVGMASRLRRHLTFANVASGLALFIALATGGAYAANTIYSTDIVDGQVMRQDLANGAVSAAKMADGTVQTAKIQSNAVTTAKIPLAAITGSRLSDTAVASKLANHLLVRTSSGTGEHVGYCNPGETMISGGANAYNNGFVPLGQSEPFPEIGTGTLVAWGALSTDPNASVSVRVVCLVP